jgi:hypothetical protein
MTPLTREEVMAWPATGAMSLKAERVLELINRLERAEAFKAYVHQRLDAMGVPADPNPEANAQHGCRVEGRLDWLCAQEAGFLALVDEMKDQVSGLDQRLAAARAEANTHWANFCERSGDFRRWRAAEKERESLKARVAELEEACRLGSAATEDRFTGIPVESPSEEVMLAIQRGLIACRDVLKKTTDKRIAPKGGCTVTCPECTRIGPIDVEEGSIIGNCAQCWLGNGRHVPLVIVVGPVGGAVKS